MEQKAEHGVETQILFKVWGLECHGERKMKLKATMKGLEFRAWKRK